MSVFDLPRLHFSGVATTKLPTGPRSGLVDLATNTALTDEGPFPVGRPVQEYHDYLDARGPRFDAAGRVADSASTDSASTDSGPFSATKGWNFGGSGHFSIDARVVSVEVSPGDIDVADPLVGRSVDMWGHYNPYLATTANRARVFDLDPSSNWTTTLMVGQFCFGREGRSHDVGYMFTGDVHGLHPPRWHNANHITDVGDHYLAPEFRRSAVYQFVVGKDDGPHWLDEVSRSPATTLLRSVVDSDAADGLVVQFALSNMSTPRVPDSPNHWDLRGTIAPWRSHELRTYPAGRLLIPSRTWRDSGRTGPHNLTLEVGPASVTFNMITAVPATSRAKHSGPGPTHRLGPLLDLDDLELRTADTDQLVARLPSRKYLGNDFALASGIVTVPREARLPADDEQAEQALCVVGTDSSGNRAVLLREQEVNLQVDDACLILEHPRDADDADHDVEVPSAPSCGAVPEPSTDRCAAVLQSQGTSARRGRAHSPEARCSDIEIMRFRAGRLEVSGAWSVPVNPHRPRGCGHFTMRGAACRYRPCPAVGRCR